MPVPAYTLSGCSDRWHPRGPSTIAMPQIPSNAPIAFGYAGVCSLLPRQVRSNALASTINKRAQIPARSAPRAAGRIKKPVSRKRKTEQHLDPIHPRAGFGRKRLPSVTNNTSGVNAQAQGEQHPGRRAASPLCPIYSNAAASGGHAGPTSRPENTPSMPAPTKLPPCCLRPACAKRSRRGGQLQLKQPEHRQKASSTNNAAKLAFSSQAVAAAPAD